MGGVSKDSWYRVFWFYSPKIQGFAHRYCFLAGCTVQEFLFFFFEAGF